MAQYKEEELLNLLESIILMQLLVENLEDAKFNHYNIQKVKMLTKSWLKEAIPVAEKDYGTVYNNGGDETVKICNQYESLVKSISKLQLPTKVLIAQFTSAFALEPKMVSGIIDKAMSKHQNFKEV